MADTSIRAVIESLSFRFAKTMPEIVSAELETSAMRGGKSLANPEQLPGDFMFKHLTSSTALAVTTWNAVLDTFETAARASGEASDVADIAQLKSLCDVMDNEAFLPVRIEELTNLELPRRLIGLADLIPELCQNEPPSNWWTPLLSSGGSGKVSNEPGTAS